tara:strand:+ start:4774 stop:5919 length:1146 start_codon:yes stop_codon:yes gene_type:complete
MKAFPTLLDLPIYLRSIQLTDFKIIYAPGDGIGPEVIEQSSRILAAIGDRFGHRFSGDYVPVGADSIEQFGTELTSDTIDKCLASDSVLLGACGIAGGAAVKGRHPELAVLGLRREMQLWTNLRPMKVYDSLLDASPVKRDRLEDVDMLVLRELTGGIYFAQPKERRIVDGERAAVDTLLYKESEVRRIVRRAFELAGDRRKHVTSVDKNNVLESSRFWREIAEDVASDFPDVQLEHVLVDAFAMRLVLSPRDFDVVVTKNMFGDIITDEMAVLSASLGMMPSASLGNGNKGLYEPIHGAAPDIAGTNQANPIGTILSAAMMLRLSLGLEDEAKAVESAVESALAHGFRTPDIAETKNSAVGTTEMGDVIAQNIISPPVTK